MKAYRHSGNLKLGLVLFALLIAVSSLVYTNRLVERLREREQFLISLWASAQEQIVSATQLRNPYIPELRELEAHFAEGGTFDDEVSEDRRQEYRRALRWAQSMPEADDVTLLTDILGQGRFGIPAVVIDSTTGMPVFWQNVPVPDTLSALSRADSLRAVQRLRSLAESMSRVYEPIPIRVDFDGSELEQYIFYDVSGMIRELRLFPYVQLLFVALFVLVGYLSFSYVRRSEQGSLWVGMAKEAAHQLGTPISSLMGWHDLLKLKDLPAERRDDALEEVGKDIDRLNRVTGRFSAIGSMPRLTQTALAPIIDRTVDYMRRRMPQTGARVRLDATVPDDLIVPLNEDLFEWVIENLVKNALDAIEGSEGQILITASEADGKVHVDVSDSGKGIDRRDLKHVFRPGFSTKKRGWGLGLSLAKRIVEVYHGGKLLLLQTRVGHGTTFRIELPRT